MALTAAKTWTYTIAITTYNSGTGYVTFYFQQYYDVSTNQSYIYVTRITVNHSTYSGRYYVNGTITADGVTVASLGGNAWSGRITSTGTAADVTGGTLPIVGGGIPHNTDGTKSVTLHITISSMFSNDSGWSSNGSGTQSVTLTTIPRASTVSCADGDIGAVKTLNISRASSAFTHTLTYAFGNASGTIASKTSNTAVSWTPPMDLCSQIPNGESGVCTITCDTYSGDTLIGTKICSVILRVPDTVCLQLSDGWATAAPYNVGTAAAALNAYVQGYSKAQVSFDSGKISTANAYGASTASYSIEYGGSAIASPDRTPVLMSAGENSIVCKVTDTRGKTVSETLTVQVLPYVKPALSEIAVFRCDSEGTEDDEGTAVSAEAVCSISALDGLNSFNLRARYRSVSGSYGDSAELQSGMAHVLWDGYVSAQQTYVVELSAVDALGNTAVYTQIIPTADVMFHGRNGGSGAAFGKYAEADDLLEVAWGLKVKQDLTVEGDANIDGDTIVGGAITVGGALSVGDATTTRTNLGLGSAATENIVPIEKGGTGAATAEEARANLGVTAENLGISASGIGAVEIKLLWGNASWNSTFAPQTISLALSGYSGIIIVYQHYCTHGRFRSMFCPIELNAVMESIQGTSGETGSIQNGLRYVDITTSYVKFSTGYYSQSGGSLGANNGVCVPCRIYGIKGVT